jgi:carbonic anhydrase
MQQILSHASTKDHYTADVCIVWCFDARFSSLYDAFIKERGYGQIDLVKIAGGAKETDFIIDQIGKSIKLHHTPHVVLMVHNECGAYGGSTDPIFYEAELKKAADRVREAFPDITIEPVFADFDGLKLV